VGGVRVCWRLDVALLAEVGVTRKSFNPWLLVLGGLAGTLAGALVALVTLHVVPSIGHPPRWERLGHDFVWALFFSSPFGVLVGSAAGLFMQWRGRTPLTFRRLVTETVLLADGGAGLALQAALPIAWQLPRVAISAVVCGSTVIVAVPIAAALAWMAQRDNASRNSRLI